MTETFKLSVGARRQITLPARLLELFSLSEGGELYVEFDLETGDAKLVPMVSIPRHLVSDSLLSEMNSRRGVKPTDLPLREFTAQVRAAAATETEHKHPVTPAWRADEDQTKQQLDQYVERGKEYYDRGRSQWAQYVEKGKGLIQEHRDRVEDAIHAGKKA